MKWISFFKKLFLFLRIIIITIIIIIIIIIIVVVVVVVIIIIIIIISNVQFYSVLFIEKYTGKVRHILIHSSLCVVNVCSLHAHYMLPKFPTPHRRLSGPAIDTDNTAVIFTVVPCILILSSLYLSNWRHH